MRDRQDGTLIVLEAEQVGYDEKAQELYLSSPDYDYFVPRMVTVSADPFIRDLFENSKVNLSNFVAIEQNV